MPPDDDPHAWGLIGDHRFCDPRQFTAFPADLSAAMRYMKFWEHDEAVFVELVDHTYGAARRRQSDALDPYDIPMTELAISRGTVVQTIQRCVSRYRAQRVFFEHSDGYLINPDLKDWSRERLSTAGLVFVKFGRAEGLRLLYPDGYADGKSLRIDGPESPKGPRRRSTPKPTPVSASAHPGSTPALTQVSGSAYPGSTPALTPVSASAYPGQPQRLPRVNPSAYPGSTAALTPAVAAYRNAREEENSEIPEENSEGEEGALAPEGADSSPEAVDRPTTPGPDVPATATGFADGTGVAEARERRLAIARWAGSIYPDRHDLVRCISQGDGGFAPDCYLVALGRLRKRPDGGKKGPRYFLGMVASLDDEGVEADELAAASIAAGLAPRPASASSPAAAVESDFARQIRASLQHKPRRHDDPGTS